jgi:hypothetical protein
MAFGDGFSAQEYRLSPGADLYRRSLYTFWKRTVPPPAMAVFDAPDREKCTGRRVITNTPLQALALLNDPVYIEAARKLAEKVFLSGAVRPNARIDYLFRLVTSRYPTPVEVKVLQSLINQQQQYYKRNLAEARKLLLRGDSGFGVNKDVEAMAAWVIASSTLLALDETISKE